MQILSKYFVIARDACLYVSGRRQEILKQSAKRREVAATVAILLGLLVLLRASLGMATPVLDRLAMTKKKE